MNQDAEERLMRYVDGNLDEEQAFRVEEWLEESSEARALVRDLSLIRHKLRGVAGERGKRSGAITDDVMSRIAAERGFRRQAPGRDGRERRIHTLIPALGLALATAAAIAIYLRPHHSTPSPAAQNEPSATAVPDPPSTTSSTAMAAQASADLAPGASIESVDFGTQNGTIFMVPAELDVTPVVWMDDDEPSNG